MIVLLDILRVLAIILGSLVIAAFLFSILVLWRSWVGPPRPDQEDEVWGDMPHWPKERQ